jgi:hypothetical protein
VGRNVRGSGQEYFRKSFCVKVFLASTTYFVYSATDNNWTA